MVQHQERCAIEQRKRLLKAQIRVTTNGPTGSSRIQWPSSVVARRMSRTTTCFVLSWIATFAQPVRCKETSSVPADCRTLLSTVTCEVEAPRQTSEWSESGWVGKRGQFDGQDHTSIRLKPDNRHIPPRLGCKTALDEGPRARCRFACAPRGPDLR